jgi:hypothetical protein
MITKSRTLRIDLTREREIQLAEPPYAWVYW